MISKGNITETTELQILANTNKELEKKNKTMEEEISTNEEKIESELSRKAKNIKLGFQTIDTKDSYYMNYDKTKLKIFLSNTEFDCKNSSNILTESNLSSLISITKPNDKSLISLPIKDSNKAIFLETQDRLKKLLGVNITEWIIDRLKNNSDISLWIEKWLEIHENHSSLNCEFCWNKIDNERIQEFKRHFNDAIKEVREKLIAAKKYIIENLINQKLDFNKNNFYSDLQNNFSEKLWKINENIESINIILGNWISCIDKKSENPTLVEFDFSELSEDQFDSFFKLKDEINSLIELHNNRFNTFDSELKKNQAKLELHYATEFQKELDYFNLIKSNKDKKINLSNEKAKLLEDKRKEDELKQKLSNETIWAGEFNKKLAKFIGHKEISLRFDKERLWYEIIRNHDKKRAARLSEGEKTAIAFVYFIIKLQEKDNLLIKEIVIVDDPLSSFDSNNIFSAYSFMKSELEEKIEQLFILTHNFSFFRLVRDWISWKNGKKDSNWILKPDKSKFYQIDVLSYLPKRSSINNAKWSIINYNSEYHFVFSKLCEYKAETKLDLEKSFQVANLARKLLESFLSFKYPKKRNDFRALLNYAIWLIDNSILPDVDKWMFEEKIFKFINKYSHLQVIPFWDDSENNQIWESNTIISEIFNLMEWIDDTHYNELVEVSS